LFHYVFVTVVQKKKKINIFKKNNKNLERKKEDN